MKVRTNTQEFETPDRYTYFGYKDGGLGFHVTLVDGKVTVYFADMEVTVYFADMELELEDGNMVRLI